MLLVTGGAGFIGANFVLSTIAATGEAARAHCAARFSEKTMLDRMEAIYASVAART